MTRSIIGRLAFDNDTFRRRDRSHEVLRIALTSQSVDRIDPARSSGHGTARCGIDNEIGASVVASLVPLPLGMHLFMM